MKQYVLEFHEIGASQAAIVGGKAEHLAALSRLDGIEVPLGFCVTTRAFRRMMAEARAQTPRIDARLAQLSRLAPGDRAAISVVSAEVRAIMEDVAIPDDVANEITAALARLGEQGAVAVRSSATAEDLPTASFAGQQDTYLNVVGRTVILQHVSKCWASLFTERAVTYRLQKGFGHDLVSMAVVIQRMVRAEAAGILFTADPLTGNRNVASVEAMSGLGDALVSGTVNADMYKVRGGEVTSAAVRTKQRVLTDAQIVRLAQLGRRIEAHFGCPQDIEWCLADDDFQIVQSRAITTLFPIPVVADGERHVYISVGHQQMMTDAMKPLGISVWQLTAARPMFEAGGRLFVDVSKELASPARRTGLLALAKSDPLIGDALRAVVDRGFIQSVPDEAPGAQATVGQAPRPAQTPIETDPAIVSALIERTQASIASLKRDIEAKSGSALLEVILADIQELKRALFDPLNHQAIMAGMEAAWWLNDHMQEWLGEKNAADTLTLSVSNNVTSEMGLALLDVADVIRPHSQVVDFLRKVANDDFLNDLPALDGGREACDAILAWLEKYGMRGVGEIDITRPRWSERPTMLLPILIGNIDNVEGGSAARRFAHGQREAAMREQEFLERLRALPDGARRAEETGRMIARLRTFIGYREYPKYGIIGRYFIYKQALMAEAERLVQKHVLREKEDVFYLTFQELQDAVRTGQIDERLIRRRKEAFEGYQALMPPRVLTSEGEAVAGAYRRDELPPGAFAGLAVSAGTVEGRARVVLDIAHADLEAGDILVTRYTDPAWTPAFVTIKGLVTEVGGQMTHGAVIAREYGLPAVVGVENATQLIQDGQRIRVNGTDGYVEILTNLTV